MHNCQHTLLTQEGLLHILGPDSLTFLQGQTSCDTRVVDDEHAAPGIYCTPQGRVVCDFLLTPLADENHYVLRMRKDIVAHAAQVFGKYIIFSKADLEQEQSDWQLLGLWGSEAAAAIHDIFGETPAQQYGAVTGTGFSVVQLDAAGTRFECYVDCSTASKQLAALQENTRQAEESLWQALDIKAGIARIDTGMVEQYVPQTLNFDLTGHISFTKGCYTGQEVVARLHYRGTPKRRSHIAHLKDLPTAISGAELFAKTASSSVGNLINPVSLDGSVLALAAATREGADSGLHLGSLDGPLLQLQELPYPLEAEADAD